MGFDGINAAVGGHSKALFVPFMLFIGSVYETYLMSILLLNAFYRGLAENCLKIARTFRAVNFIFAK